MVEDVVLSRRTLQRGLRLFWFSSRRRHTRCLSDWSSDVCSSDLKTIVTFTAPNKMKFEGVINDQNFVERVETWYSSPVLGDTKFEADFSDYKDFAGVKFPTHIVQRNGPYPILDIDVTDVKPNVAVAIDVPANIRTASAPPATPQAEKISDGLWMVQGTVK